jgi:tetratricopeptide (TPR) repeat protein
LSRSSRWTILLRRNMAKIGRNDPCPCGSGKKQKKCCSTIGDSSAELATSAVEPSVPYVCDSCGKGVDDEINDRADHILDQLLEGRVDEAEALCHAFIQDFPAEAEGLDLLSMVFEERGQRDRALALLRQASNIAHANPAYDAETRLLMRQRIGELELRA